MKFDEESIKDFLSKVKWEDAELYFLKKAYEIIQPKLTKDFLVGFFRNLNFKELDSEKLNFIFDIIVRKIDNNENQKYQDTLSTYFKINESDTNKIIPMTPSDDFAPNTYPFR